MVVFAGQGDARRSIALLWRNAGHGDPPSGTRPGPKPGLSVDEIVAAAIAVADAEGMSALSMRAVGERLGRTAMALYTYVPRKSELIDLMYDQALAELPTDYPAEAGWRAVVTDWARDLWALYVRHPWMLQVSQARPVLGPHEYAAVETVTGLFRETDLPAGKLRRIIGTLFQFVRATAQTAAEARQAVPETGVSEEEWWFSRTGTLQEIVPDFASRFPMLVWLESQEHTPRRDSAMSYLEGQAAETFEAGLGVLLDGVEVAMSGEAGEG
ncbi:TetR/AcrR family transcriptional regulator C-terminal domain-containing protein [Amycolatopsis cihanbeyliensis]|uniref:TetR family transcriptional regulator n=1 Tax=Amycolatopsis cihanbeyliensis TaxID=1128664 RepID=A0A542DR58_AMYCI|nr:TetR/AcrR family transcriptional regulator C-terminal domain-containing protein [Amycolatopsis cihanbeyliensis]TQJ05484.1 TetR family transcriptional regulator [Amycolatopsis cihanbeyliensis]